MYHQPHKKISIILGDGAIMAKTLGVKVINDFRAKDIAAGGEGAPFAPIYHHALAMQKNHSSIAVVNCGGIANVSFILSQQRDDLIAFDTGPGNALIDRFIKRQTRGTEHIDQDGKYGQNGKVDNDILKKLYDTSVIKNGKNYFLIPPPKSLDSSDLFLIPEVEALSIEDGARTLEAFTADSIVKSLDWLATKNIPTTWVLAGGGWKNPVIYTELNNRLTDKLGTPVQLIHSDTLGWSSDAMEAELFAYLAVRSLQHKPLSFPGTTNTPHPITGGVLHLP